MALDQGRFGTWTRPWPLGYYTSVATIVELLKALQRTAVLAFAAAFGRFTTALAFAGVLSLATVVTGFAATLAFAFVLTFAPVLTFLVIRHGLHGNAHFRTRARCVSADRERSG